MLGMKWSSEGKNVKKNNKSGIQKQAVWQSGKKYDMPFAAGD